MRGLVWVNPECFQFLSWHPGGELAILTFAGKGAAAELDMVPSLAVLEVHGPDAIFTVICGGTRSYDVNVCYYSLLSVPCGICATIFSVRNFKILSDRAFSWLFIVVHAVVNRANPRGQTISTAVVGSVSAITDLMVLTFMTGHLFQFVFADTVQRFLGPPPSVGTGGQVG